MNTANKKMIFALNLKWFGLAAGRVDQELQL